MKVLLHYEDNENSDLHKTLKITLPKSWKTGPTSKVLVQFIETYNSNESLGGGPNPLQESEMHLALRDHTGEKSVLRALASDAITVETIPDRADVYVCHGPSRTLQEIKDEEEKLRRDKEEELKNTVQCTRFGCRNRFPRGGPYPDCRYHLSPPVFHETAKFWSCCPHKKAYEWDEFQSIPGCQTGVCTEVKESEGKQFLGGCDLREAAGESVKLKSIDDFNKAQAAGGSDAAPVLDRLQAVFEELGVEKELFEQVVTGIKKEQESTGSPSSDAELLELVKAELGSKLKASMKAIVVEQLRIK
jgi:hypothetical protein